MTTHPKPEDLRAMVAAKEPGIMRDLALGYADALEEIARLREALEYCARDDRTHPENRKSVARAALGAKP